MTAITTRSSCSSLAAVQGSSPGLANGITSIFSGSLSTGADGHSASHHHLCPNTQKLIINCYEFPQAWAVRASAPRGRVVISWTLRQCHQTWADERQIWELCHRGVFRVWRTAVKIASLFLTVPTAATICRRAGKDGSCLQATTCGRRPGPAAPPGLSLGSPT